MIPSMTHGPAYDEYRRKVREHRIEQMPMTDDDRAKLVTQVSEATMVDCSDWTKQQLVLEAIRRGIITSL
jgi:hypothetical protein